MEENPPRSRMAVNVPIYFVIVATTLASTGSSMGGGLVLYFKGIESLADSVAETSEGDVFVLRENIMHVLKRARAYIYSAQLFLYSERIHTHDPLHWANLTRTFWYSQLHNSTLISSIKTDLYPKNDTHSPFSSTLRKEQGGLIFTEHGANVNNRTTHPNTQFTVHEINPETGEVVRFVRVETTVGRFWNKTDLDLQSGVFPKEAKGVATVFETQVDRAEYAHWIGPMLHTSVIGTKASYLTGVAYFAPPPPPHPWSHYDAVSIEVAILYEVFAAHFTLYKQTHPDTSAALIDRNGGVVLASTYGVPVMVEGCTGGEECLFYVQHFPALRCALEVLSGEPIGELVVASVEGEDHFLRRGVVVHTWEIVWMRPTSTVQGKVQDALKLLIMFTLLVFLFDGLVAVAEVVFIVRPIHTVSEAVRQIGHMRTREAARSMRACSEKRVMLKEFQELTHGLAATVWRLDNYKSFIPESIFLQRSSAGEQQEPYGLLTGTAAVVFTDIRQSTLLWEQCHDGMRVGLQMHNSLLRECIEEHEGYEVKTIGDSFMVTFADVSTAVLFGLEVQTRLIELDWPDSLLDLAPCAADATGNWNGIRVRIGVHCGPVLVEQTEMGRCDYTGATVNIAARLENACTVGAVAVLDTMLADIDSKVRCTAKVISIGKQHLKSADKATEDVSVLVPLALPQRAHYIQKCANGANPLAVPAKKRPARVSGHVPERFTESLDIIASATVGRVCEQEDNMRDSTVANSAAVGLSRMMVWIERSGGKVLSVLGRSVFVSWNVVLPCSFHMDSAFRFLALASAQRVLRCGMSTGKLLHGNIGDKGQRYITAAGETMQLCIALFDKAYDLQVPCVYAPSERSAISHPGLKQYLRPIFEGTVSGLDVVVHQIHIKKLTDAIDVGFDYVDSSLDEAEEDAWGTAYFAAFTERDMPALEAFCKTDPTLRVALAHTFRHYMKQHLLGGSQFE